MSSKPNATKIVWAALMAVFVVYIFAELATNIEQRQWDFRSYYYAAATHADGGDPYDTAQLNRRSGGLTVLPFIYPPPTLYFFRLFTALPFATAYLVWLILKIILAIGLIFIWRQYLFPDEPLLPFSLFLLLAFGATFYIDFVTGNVTIIEQALLWLGIALLMRGRALGFCVTLILASAFKLTPIFFVLLLPLLNVRKNRHWLFGTIGICAGAFAVAYWIEPSAWSTFFTRVTAADEAGRLGNPSTLSLWRDLFASIADKWAATIPDAVPLAFYLLTLSLVGVVSWGAIKRVRSSGVEERDQLIVFLSCVAFALIMPRFKTYSFMLLLPPAYFTIRRCGRQPAFWALFALMALSASTPFPVSPYLRMFWMYYPLLLGFLIWGLLLRHIRLQTTPSLGESQSHALTQAGI